MIFVALQCVSLKYILFVLQNIMSLHDLESGKKLYDFPLELGTIAGISGKRQHTECFYSFCSFLTPNTIYRVKFNDSNVDVSVKTFICVTNDATIVHF